jgi:hypothetical protein
LQAKILRLDSTSLLRKVRGLGVRMRKNFVLLVVAFGLILTASLAMAEFIVDPVLKEKLPGYFAEDDEYYYLYALQGPGGLTIIDPYGTEIIKIPKEAIGKMLATPGRSGGVGSQSAVECYIGEDAEYYYLKARVDPNGVLTLDPDGGLEIKVLKSAVGLDNYRKG